MSDLTDDMVDPLAGVWADPMGRWTPEQADAARATLEAARRRLANHAVVKLPQPTQPADGSRGQRAAWDTGAGFTARAVVGRAQAPRVDIVGGPYLTADAAEHRAAALLAAAREARRLADAEEVRPAGALPPAEDVDHAGDWRGLDPARKKDLVYIGTDGSITGTNCTIGGRHGMVTGAWRARGEIDAVFVLLDSGPLLHCPVSRVPVPGRPGWRAVLSSREVNRDQFDRIIGADEYRRDCGWRAGESR